MAVEPGVVDANVLAYALDVSAPQHAATRALLEAGRNRSATLYVTLQILCEFYSVVTNPRRVLKPRAAAEVLSAIVGMMRFLELLPIPTHTAPIWLELLGQHPVIGADVFDLQIVASMQANGVGRIYTFNADDFASVANITVAVP
jgi:predicted nucleic acid-binding protein